jgi:hypothetical protein
MQKSSGRIKQLAEIVIQSVYVSSKEIDGRNLNSPDKAEARYFRGG